MVKLRGRSVYKGIAMGKIFIFNKNGSEVSKKEISDPEAETIRLHDAVGKGKDQLGILYDKALREAGKDGAEIFEMHMLLIEDQEFLKSAVSIIKTEKVCAEYAVWKAGNMISEKFSAMEDEYFAARAADIQDVSKRLTDILMGSSRDISSVTEPVIVIARDLTPSEILSFDRAKVLALAMEMGSANSHSSILARMMGIPTLIGCENMKADGLKNGTTAIADANEGILVFDPDTEEIKRALSRIRSEEEEKSLLASMKGLESITKDGKKISIFANISGADDCYECVKNDAEGIGLMRSEFLYLGRDSFPAEEEQFNAYKAVAETLGDRTVIIRTLDLGADKKVSYLDPGEEENPALGCRAIRICLTHTDIFRTQLRALLRAAVYGNIEIMYPMIISVDEVKKIRAFVEKTARELEAEGIAYRIPKQGIMIETPAAVLIADDLAKEADFFSIGTNDLTQYTLAIDRQNDKLADFYDPHHPAVLKMIKMTVDAAHANGIRAGLCGELGADRELLPYFLEIGLDEISVAASSVLSLRQFVREMG